MVHISSWLIILLCTQFSSGGYISGEDSVELDHDETTASRETSCPCGWSNKARIVGGREAKKNEFPFIVAIKSLDSNEVFCGGSIITRYHVLSASHCTEPSKEEQLSVLAGAHNISDDTGVIEIEVDHTIEHEDYDTETYKNDVALLVLKKPFEFNQNIGPVCLPSGKVEMNNELLKAMGWGKLNYRSDIGSTVLMTVNLRTFDIHECSEKFPTMQISTTSRKQICTFRPGKDSCSGDSGGPLVWIDPEMNRYTQVALVSFGGRCGKKRPAVNTDVGIYMEWILGQILGTSLQSEVCQKI